MSEMMGMTCAEPWNASQETKILAEMKIENCREKISVGEKNRQAYFFL